MVLNRLSLCVCVKVIVNETTSVACHINIYSHKIIPIYDSITDQMVNLASGSGSDTQACNFQTGFLNGSGETMAAMRVDSPDAAEFS